MERYPRWLYFPRSVVPPPWVARLVDVFSRQQPRIDTSTIHNKSDDVLAIIREGLEEMEFDVEGGTHAKTIYRPVHFGEFGKADREYHIDSYHSGEKIGLEVEAGRSLRGNAVYRDIVQASLLVDVDFFALAIPQHYRFKAKGQEITDRPYEATVSIFDAIYSSQRLRLPLRGCLVIGY
ncbi:MAG: hypothetical protein JXB04_09590 [Kiritimatiellae bacterium]|nr:hypothetical protein [Kiritimatiellia bacterium]